MPADNLRVEFEQRFGATPRLFRAPGRVNLIGEHTDYNDGFVLPAAIDFSCFVAVAPRQDGKLVMHWANFDETVDIELAHAQPRHHWSDYVVGVAVDLQRAGYKIGGASLLIQGEVPLGAGLASSAALEVAAGYALLQAAGHRVDRTQLAKLCQAAENKFVGARCGIMDQFVACHGRAGHALLLDCRTLEHRLLPIPRGVSLVICNTMVKHSIAGGEYNRRRAQCEEAVKTFARHVPAARALRDLSMEDFNRFAGALEPVVRRRARHVISENARVLAAAAALESGNLADFGRLMGESHQSLRDDYQVTDRELDLMVDLAARVPGVIGARMTGGGFGGCTISLVRDDAVAQFRSAVAREYTAQLGRKPEIYLCRTAGGVAEVQD